MDREPSSGDERDWITPDNLGEMVNKMNVGETVALDEPIPVACMTADFAIQNVLLHMGIKVISVEGMIIKQLRTHILRCTSCFKTTSIMTKQFCPTCGNMSLRKVPVAVNPEDGTMHIFLSKRRTPTSKGLKYSLPAPRGGKHAVNPILFEDQRIPQNRLSKKAMEKLNVFDPDYASRPSPFLDHDVNSRSAVLGLHKYNKSVSTRGNPNDHKRGRKRGGKRS